jgi:hypothetical protein
MDKRGSLCHGPVGTTGKYRSEVAEIEELHRRGRKVKESFATRLFWTSTSPRRPRKALLVKRAARRRCLKDIGTYFSTSRRLSAAIFNTLIALRRLSGTSLYYQRFGRFPDYANPRSYSEKVQWRKVFDRNPEFSVFCDKLAARELARLRAPALRHARILWCGDDVEAIPLETLTPPFVVKPSNQSNCIITVRQPGDLKPFEIRNSCRQWMAMPPHGAAVYEWGYRGTVRKIIVEQFLSRQKELVSPVNIKIFVFAGKARWIFYSDQHAEQRGVYTPQWEPLPVDRWRKGRLEVLSMAVPAPPNLETMVASAEAIAAGSDHARVDLYDVDGSVFFGEITAYPYAGYTTWVRKGSRCDPYAPRDIDDEFGAHWLLPEIPWPTRLYRGLFG